MADKNLKNMMFLDIYLNSLNPDEYKAIQPKLHKHSAARHPLLCWDIVLLQRELRDAKRKRGQSDIRKLEELQKKFDWNLCVPEVLDAKYDALVLTDTQKVIQWVNDGFYSMTGYQAEEAIGRSPGFLQGVLTSAASRKRIKRGLATKRPFAGQVVNYRKHGPVYTCHLMIYPIENHQKMITHYLALESEVFA